MEGGQTVGTTIPRLVPSVVSMSLERGGGSETQRGLAAG
jgi:hypothetical protein